MSCLVFNTSYMIYSPGEPWKNVSLLPQKRPVPVGSQDRLAVKRQKLSDQRMQPQPAANALSNSKGAKDAASLPFNPTFHTKTEFQRTSIHTGGQDVSSMSEAGGQQPNLHGHKPPQGDAACTPQQLASGQHRKKKSKRHKDKERERLKDNQGPTDWTETSPDLKQNPDKFHSKVLSCSFQAQYTFVMT